MSLSCGFKEVFSELNSLLDNPRVTVAEREYTLKFFLGGDYKVDNKYTYYLTISKNKNDSFFCSSNTLYILPNNV